MYELIRAGECSYYLDCPAKIGIYDAGEGVYLIDSGGDRDAGRRARRVLDERGWRLLGIVNTHSHADHIGGNQYLQRQTGCRVFAPEIEAGFVRAPILEPSLLYGGCPPAALRHKFLMAQPSEALPLTDGAFPSGLRAVPLPGHSFEQMGYITPDGTAFIADSVASTATLDKYPFPFIYDAAAYLETLAALPELDCARFVPSHAPACEDIRPLAEENIRRTEALGDMVLRLCAQPRTAEELLALAFDEAGLTLDIQQYALSGSTLRSLLTWHQNAGRVTARIEQNRLLWERI